MPWFKVDDGFWSHPKVVELSPEAVALWVRAGAYAAQHLTDGAVSSGALRMLASSRETADELVMAGLWEPKDARTWEFKDWAEYQPSRESVLAERAAAAERKRVSRERSRKESQRDSRVTAGVTPASPTRPDPTRPFSPSNEGEKPREALSPFCYRHPNGTDKKCRDCGTARLAYNAAGGAKETAPDYRNTTAYCDEHPDYPMPCDKCRRLAEEDQ